MPPMIQVPPLPCDLLRVVIYHTLTVKIHKISRRFCVSLCSKYDKYGAPCTRYGLHFLHILKRTLQIFSLQQFLKCNLNLQQMGQFIIFILQQARYLGPSHLHSSMKVGTNLCLRVHAKTIIFKSSGKPAGSPKYAVLCNNTTARKIYLCSPMR